MEIILLRHAQKEGGMTHNPPLSVQGQRQALNLAEMVRQGQLPAPRVLLASDWLRTQQTLTPLAQQSGLAIELNTLLNEQKPGEARAQFFKRVQIFWEQLPTAGPVYICTHFDWTEATCHLLNFSDYAPTPIGSSWESGQYVYFMFENRREGLTIFSAGSLKC